MPRCRNPMSQSRSMTVSPSSLRMTLSTPCVEGCCGPMFRIISGLSSSFSLVAMQESDVAVEIDDGLAVELKDDPQHAMRRRMLRPHVQDHLGAVEQLLSGCDAGIRCRSRDR